MITDYHAKLFAHELSKRHSVADAEKLASTLLDAQDHILIAAVTDEGKPIDSRTSLRLFELPSCKKADGAAAPPQAVVGALDKQHEQILKELATRQAEWFDQEMEKLDNWAEDKRAGLKLDLKELDDQIKEFKRQIRHTGNLPDKLSLQRKVRDLEKKRDDAWRAYDEAAKAIEVQKDSLLDEIERHLAQDIATEGIFTITFEVI